MLDAADKEWLTELCGHTCGPCTSKDSKIRDLKGQVEFHKNEAKRWRDMFNEQRGGKVFDEMQRRVVKLESDISHMATYLEGGS
jgi:hypothetical protein